jgi:hypothetical protein
LWIPDEYGDPTQLEQSASDDGQVKAGWSEFCSPANRRVISRHDKSSTKSAMRSPRFLVFD